MRSSQWVYLNLKDNIFVRLAFSEFLKLTKRIYRTKSRSRNTIFPFECYVYYAWDDDDRSRYPPTRLIQLKEDLHTAGIKVTLESCNTTGDTLEKGITRAYKCLMICTPQLKKRAENPHPDLVIKAAIEKTQQFPDFIIPLIFVGDVHKSLPGQFANLVVHNFVDEQSYYRNMSSLSPKGTLYRVSSDPQNPQPWNIAGSNTSKTGSCS